MKNLKETNIWIVLNEDTLNTMKGKGGKTAKFSTKEDANMVAAGKLNMWVCIHVNFNHEFLNHKL